MKRARPIEHRVDALPCGLDTSLTGWRRVFAFVDARERVHSVSLTCVAFLNASSALKLSASFDPSHLVLFQDGVDTDDDDSLDFSKIAKAVARFPALVEISVDLYCTVGLGDRDYNVHPDVFAEGIGALFAFTCITTLTLRECHLTVLPDGLCDLTALTFLHLEKNQLTALPSSINALTCLESLHLYDNALTALPPSLVHSSRWRSCSSRTMRCVHCQTRSAR